MESQRASNFKNIMEVVNYEVRCRKGGGGGQTFHGVQVEYAGHLLEPWPLLVAQGHRGGEADDDQAPVQVVVDGHKEEVPAEDVLALPRKEIWGAAHSDRKV